MDDRELRGALERLSTPARDVLRRASRADQWERDELAARLMREPNGQLMAELIDELSIDAEARRQMVRVLGELEAES
jgi:hypothetical protein